MTILIDQEQSKAFLTEPLPNYPVVIDPFRPDPAFPGIVPTTRAAFSTESIFGAVRRGGVFESMVADIGGIEADPDYSIAEDFRLKDNMALQEFVLGSDSFDETTLRLIELRRLQEEHQTIQDAGGFGTFASVIGSLVNWDVLIPISKVKAASRLARGGKALGWSLALGVPQEAVISANTPTRTNAQSLMNIGAIAVTGSIFGALGGGVPKAKRSMDIGEDAEVGVRTDETDLGADIYEPEPPRAEGASVGAAEAEGAFFRRSRAEQLRAEALATTGSGLENIFEPMFPVLRMLGSGSAVLRGAITDLVDSGGLIKEKNVPGAFGREAQATRASVETVHRARWVYPLVEAIRATDRHYLSYVGKPSRGGPGDAFSVAQGREGFLSAKQFRVEVGKAMARGDAHEIPEVAAAASMWRNSVVKPMEDAAKESGLFTRELEKEMGEIKRRIATLNEKLQKGRDIGARSGKAKQIQDELELEHQALTNEATALQQRIKKIEAEGPTTNTAPSYFPRVYNHRKIAENRGRFEDVLVRELGKKFKEGERPSDAFLAKQADEITDAILRLKPYLAVGDEPSLAGPLRERTLDIPDGAIEEFLERDVEIVLRQVQQSVTKDIELTNRFGDISMKETIDAIKAEYDELIELAGGEAKANLKLEQKARLQDLEDVRDRFRGTFGSTSDPMRPVSRAIRIAKSINNLTLMGGATISSISDLARVVQTEGLNRAFGTGYAMMFGEQAKTLRRMARNEANRAGVAVDMVLALRAFAMADISDVYARRTAMEQALGEANQRFFLLNGLNLWNTAMKEWAAVAVSDRLSQAILKASRGKASGIELTKLARSGIAEGTIDDIAEMLGEHSTIVNGVRMPNTDLWQNAAARKAYREAISQDVERTIITPGAGDRALWTSTELGSLIAQFQSFGQAAIPRTVISGLQEGETSFLQGALLAVALGGFVEESKRLLRGDDRPRTAGEVLVDAVDRSGMTGFMSSVNSAIESASEGAVGLRPLMGAPPHGPGVDLFSLAGPVARNVELASLLTRDLLTGEVDAGTGRTLSNLLPGQNLPYVQAAETLGAP
jgi:hypothetical protein